MSYFADDAHWGALTGLTQGVVPQDPGQQGHGGLLLGAAQDVGPQVVDVHDCHRVAQSLGQPAGGTHGVGGGEDHVVVIGRDGALGGAVDAPGLGPGHDVEPALPAEQLANDAAEGGEQDAQGAALPQGHLHSLRDAQTDAGGGLGHIAAEGDGQLPGLDVLHGDGPVLGAGHRLLGDEKNVPLLHPVLGVADHHVGHVVSVGDQVGLYRDTLVVHPVHRADQLLAGVCGIGALFFAHGDAPLRRQSCRCVVSR